MGSHIKITRAIDGRSRSNKITFTAKRGQLVVEDGAAIAEAAAKNVFNPEVPWKLADGTKGVHLERDVVEGPLPLSFFMRDTMDESNEVSGFISPEVLHDNGDDTFSGYASARMVEEVELEGPDLIDDSIDDETAVNTEVSTKDGKICTVGAASAPAEVYGIIRAQLVPLEDGNVRVLVEVLQ